MSLGAVAKRRVPGDGSAMAVLSFLNYSCGEMRG